MNNKKNMGDYSQEISTVAKFGGSGPYQPENVEKPNGYLMNLIQTL